MKHRAITFAFSIVSSLALASDTWTLDSRSNVRLFQSSQENSELFDTGVARMTGKVKLDTNDPDNPVLDLTIYPADEYWRHAFSADSALPAGHASDATDQTPPAFKSKRVLRIANGELEVIGDFGLTRVELSVAGTPTEAYAGAAFGDPVVHADTREIRFQFLALGAGCLSGRSIPATLHGKAALEIVGVARGLSRTVRRDEGGD